MPDYTEVTSESWFGRIGGALKGIVFGVLLIAIAFFVLFKNEGRAVNRYKTLKEGAGIVVSVGSEAVDSANEGKLIHLTGLATTDEILKDPAYSYAPLPEYACVMSSKYELVKMATDENVFRTRYFAWVDIGYHR